MCVCVCVSMRVLKEKDRERIIISTYNIESVCVSVYGKRVCICESKTEAEIVDLCIFTRVEEREMADVWVCFHTI